MPLSLPRSEILIYLMGLAPDCCCASTKSWLEVDAVLRWEMELGRSLEVR